MQHVINATGTVTFLGGSVMPPEVVVAWVDASRHFVNLLDLHDKVGRRIARLVGVEAALVTTGAAGAPNEPATASLYSLLEMSAERDSAVSTIDVQAQTSTINTAPASSGNPNLKAASTALRIV